MSARSYGVCPRCRERHLGLAKQARAKAEAAYGKVPQSVYLALRQKAAEASHPTVPAETLAEYYELGVEPDGTFVVNYSAGCRECGFEFTFKHRQAVEVEPRKE